MVRESEVTSSCFSNERAHVKRDVRHTKWIRRQTNTRQYILGLGKTRGMCRNDNAYTLFIIASKDLLCENASNLISLFL